MKYNSKICIKFVYTTVMTKTSPLSIDMATAVEQWPCLFSCLTYTVICT